jgi:hypothetical protein
MKRTLALSILTVFFTISFMSLVGFNNQNPTKEQSSVSKITPKDDYELQEKCEKRCDKYFKEDYGNGFDEDVISNYTYHYNKKLNKCFILINSIEFIRNIGDKYENITMKTLFEFNENKEYGSLVLFRKNIKTESCFVLDKPCNSEQEWDLLVVPYMEE